MELSQYANPVFIAKVVDFVIFVVAIVWIYNRFLKGQLEAHQEAQNKAVEDAVAERASWTEAADAATLAIDKAKADAARMVEIAQAQGARLIVDEKSAAQAHAERIVSHASGELERERYRVRRELLEETVERAHSLARDIVKRELGPDKQRALIESLIADLERARA